MLNNLWNTYNGQPLSIDKEIHVFKLNFAEYDGIDFTSILSVEEISKAKRFHHKADKDSFIVRKIFLRKLLARLLCLQPENINFSNYRNKKPALAGVHFNSSHSKEYITIVLSSIPVGIDIEYLDRKINVEALMSASCSPEESAFIIRSADRSLSFYTIWTRKEALLKATGEGLVDELDQVRVLNEMVERDQHFYQLQSLIEDDYIVSICAELRKGFKLTKWDKIIYF